MSESFKFDQFELRTATPADAETARVWTAADPWHRDKIAPEFWTEKSNGVETYMMNDATGELMLVRIERVARIYIQFRPVTPRKTRERVRVALGAGLDFLSVALGVKGYGEILFDSTSTLLRGFVSERLGFRSKPDTLARRIPVFNRKPKDEPQPNAGVDVARQGQKGTVAAQHATLEGDK